ncbi:hypothetical protein [Citrobacter freundii]|uniref:hypothetical protein n=1 Tax=Citrobacter freundii TaxID=546 RepID=UPI001DEFBD34|nr:hypothetical protein [Citrobacter freundii]CAE7299746.1 hypothetical protein AI2609V1_2963 [Citrobacter freundii]CAH3678320.1 hypothetical protein AI2609V1_2963 [Citrobacter freundii]
MKELIELIYKSNTCEVFDCWRFIKRQKQVFIFNVDVNKIISAVLNESFSTGEVGYMFYLSSKPSFVPASTTAVSLSARDINKIVKYVWREQQRRRRAERRESGFDDGIPF